MPGKTSFTSLLEKYDSPLWGYHFKVPVEIARKYITTDDRRIICSFNNEFSTHCALMPNGNDEWFITVNKKIRDKLNLQLKVEVQLTIEKDNSEYGLPITEELQELLTQDEEGNELFHALTPGKQRNLLYIAQQVKNPDKRMIRALVIVEHLKIHNGKIDFKALNNELKSAKTI